MPAEAGDPPADVPTVGLDADWIVDHVEIDGVSPLAAEFDGFIGTGQMSRNARFRLDWGDADGPPSVVVKVPSADAGTRAASFEHGVYAKECHFYRALAPLVGVTVPRALHVHLDPPDDFTIVMEDLDRSEQGDQFGEPSHEQLALAIEQAAALHAPVWGTTAGRVFDPLRSDLDERAARTAQIMPVFLTTVVERLGDGLDGDVVALLERFAARAGDWIRVAGVPTTLVHGDFRPDNFLFGIDRSAPPIAVVDWQTSALGLGATDVAYLLAGSLTPERRRAEEAALLSRYVDALGRRGVALPLEQCRADYALGSLHGVVIAMTATTVAGRTERGDALFTLMLNRHGRHALDVEALDRIAPTT